jgi:hypothetical protein
MEDNLEIHLEEVHPEGVCLESHLLIYMLDLLDGQHLTWACSYHHGINHLLCSLYQNQQLSCHTRSYNIQFMSKTLILMFTSEYSKRPLKLMVKLWNLTSLTCLVYFKGSYLWMGRKLCSRPSKLHFWRVGASILQAIQNYKEWWGGLHAIAKHTTTNHQICRGLLWTPIEAN